MYIMYNMFNTAYQSENMTLLTNNAFSKDWPQLYESAVCLCRIKLFITQINRHSTCCTLHLSWHYVGLFCAQVCRNDIIGRANAAERAALIVRLQRKCGCVDRQRCHVTAISTEFFSGKKTSTGHNIFREGDQNSEQTIYRYIRVLNYLNGVPLGIVASAEELFVVMGAARSRTVTPGTWTSGCQ